MKEQNAQIKTSRRSAVLVISVIILAAVVYFLFRNFAIRADVAASGTLKVLVNDEVGIPLKEATVRITSDQTDQTFTITQKDQNGYYRAQVGSGSFTVEAESNGYKKDSQPTSVSQGQEQEITFFLQSQ